MFFALSKLLRIFIIPFWWVLFLGVWAILTKSPRTRKRLVTAICILVIVLTNPFLLRVAQLGWEPAPAHLPAGAVYEAGIVLGGLSQYDKDFNGFFGNNSDRFIQTANLYHQHFIKKVVISGGTGKFRQNEPGEAIFLREQFIANGVDSSDIIIESTSRNTFENAVFTKRVLDSMKMKGPFILITSAQHMPRSAAIFKKVGFSFIQFPCDYKKVPRNFEFEDALLPDLDVMNQWSLLISEWVGYFVYKVTGKL